MIKELYEFSEVRLPSTTLQTRYFTSANIEQSYDGDTYTAVTIGRSKIQNKQEITKNELSVYFPIDDDFAKYFLDEKDSVLNFILREYDTDTETATTIFVGSLKIVGVKKGQIELKFESKYTSAKKRGLNRLIQRACNHDLYGAACGLTKSTYEELGTITVLNPDTPGFYIAETVGFDLHYFTYGTVENLDGAVCFVILNATAGQFVVDKIPQSFIDEFDDTGSVSVKLYPGCLKTITTCQDKFNNAINYGGFPFMPVTDFFKSSRFL